MKFVQSFLCAPKTAVMEVINLVICWVVPLIDYREGNVGSFPSKQKKVSVGLCRVYSAVSLG